MKTAELRTLLRSLYDHYRTARMNQKYYGAMLVRTRRTSTILDAAVALGTSSAVASWSLWKQGLGLWVWGLLSGGVVLISLVRPLLNYPKRIETYSRLYAGHGDVWFDLKLLAERAAQLRDVTGEMEASYRAALERSKKLAPDDDPDPDRKLLRRCYEEVKKEIPGGALWTPQDSLPEENRA